MIRRVVGKTVSEVSATELDELRAGRPLLVDVGTGDGKHVLHEARARAGWFVVGVDAAPAQLQRASSSAARKPAKGGLANALFVQAAAESLPAELAGAAELHVLMPWGSLLRGCLRADGVLPSLRSVAASGARLLLTLNLHAWRPAVPEVGDGAEPTPDSALGSLAPLYAASGWDLTTAHYLDAPGIDALATSWARRLHSSRDQFDVLAIEAVAR